MEITSLFVYVSCQICGQTEVAIISLVITTNHSSNQMATVFKDKG